MNGWDTFWLYTWWMFEAFIVVGSLFLVIWIMIDLFRDRTLAGGWKALWIIFLVFVPLIAALVYLIARGQSMAARMSSRGARPAEDDSYRPAASASPSDDIAKAQQLLDQGVISQGEFDALKSKALGRQYFG
jgi:hypothetical protein